MKSIKDTLTQLTLKKVRDINCEECGTEYALYQTPAGVTGACKHCTENKFLSSLNLPKVEDIRTQKMNNLIFDLEAVTSDLIPVTVNSYKPKNQSQLKAKQEAIKMITAFDKATSLVYSGTPGLGKSHLSYAIIKALREKGMKALFIKTTHLLDRIKNTYNKHSDISEEQIFNLIEELDVLALDDVGSEYVKGNENGHESWASDVLYKIFDMRMEKTNICTTNYSERDLITKYGMNGPRINSRMLNRAIAIRLEGDDQRVPRK